MAFWGNGSLEMRMREQILKETSAIYLCQQKFWDMNAVDALMAMVSGSNSQSELWFLGLGFYLLFDDQSLGILIYDCDS